MDQINFSAIVGEVQKHQRVFVIEEMERKQYTKQVKQLDPKSSIRQTDSKDKVWCLKKFKLDKFADIEIEPEWIINLKEYKLRINRSNIYI